MKKFLIPRGRRCLAVEYISRPRSIIFEILRTSGDVGESEEEWKMEVRG